MLLFKKDNTGKKQIAFPVKAANWKRMKTFFHPFLYSGSLCLLDKCKARH